jgi:hypothetical protein
VYFGNFWITQITHNEPIFKLPVRVYFTLFRKTLPYVANLEFEWLIKKRAFGGVRTAGNGHKTCRAAPEACKICVSLHIRLLA